MISTTWKVRFVRGPDRSRAIMAAPEASEAVPTNRVPRISRLMALAIHFDRLVREARVADLSEIARLAHVTQPRMTQIMNLNHLAPDIQEELLFLPRILSGRTSIHERMLRPVCSKHDWQRQRQAWQRLRAP